MKIREEILPLSPARCGKKLRGFAGVTVHETANAAATATADAHLRYLRDNGGKNKEVSYHYVVDDTEAIHLIPNDEVAWHAGDGAAGRGNNETLAVELCVNAGGDFTQTVANAAELIAALLHEKGLHTAAGSVFEHHTFSPWGKNCPARLRAGECGGMAALRAAVQQRLDALWHTVVPADDAAQPDTPLPTAARWRVQAGVFTKRENALQQAKLLQNAGFTCCVTEA